MAIILGIETSCDDAACAVVADGRRVLAEGCASLAADMAAWGGVVPEIAARGHVLALPGLVEAVLAEAGLAARDLDAIAVAAWPGLVGSLLPGVTCAKMMALRLGKPLLAADHIRAHLAAVQLGRSADAPPFCGLVASGGHSHLYACRADAVDLLGGTIDDAAGEAFDKAAAVLGLGYPGGPAIQAAAVGGDARALALPRPFLRDETLRFSFAGLKTAFLYAVRGPQGRAALALDAQGLRDAAASFQEAVVDCLAGKLLQAAEQGGWTSVAVGGGVACNRRLRERLAVDCARRGLELLLPEPRHCADNGAMIAALGESLLRRGEIAGPDLRPLPTGTAGPRARKR